MTTRPEFHFHTGRYPAALYTVTEKYMNSVSGSAGQAGASKTVWKHTCLYTVLMILMRNLGVKLHRLSAFDNSDFQLPACTQRVPILLHVVAKTFKNIKW